MTAERWQVVKELFDRCLTVDPAKRHEFLAELTSDREICTEVSRLLRNLGEAGTDFLDPPEIVRHAFETRSNLLKPGDLLVGRFRIDCFIGGGGMGEVYQAHDLELSETIAVKALKTSRLLAPDASIRFRREIQLARRVTHPNVCRVFDIDRHRFDWGEVEFFTMELLNGVTLSDSLRENGAYSAIQVQPILGQILAGLQSAHALGIVHRDLKPSNIMLVSSGSLLSGEVPPRVVLMDFGLARIDDGTTATSLTTTGDVLGTLAYISPEQLTGGAITPRTVSASDPAALMGSVREASNWVRETVGESAERIAMFDRLPADVTTPSWEALSLYSRARNLFMKQDLENATLEVEAALRIDPQFTLAALSRADMLMTRARQTEGLKQWRSAIHMLEARQVTRAEELNARGMFAFDSGDLNAADRYFQTWALEYPNDWRGLFYRAIPLMLDGHAAEALQILGRVIKLAPSYADVYAQTVNCYLLLNQTDRAREWVARMRKLSTVERADLKEGFVRFRDGDCVGFLEILRSIQRSNDYRAASDAMLHEAILFVDSRLPEAAAARVEAFLAKGSWAETVPEQASLLIVGAWAHMRAGHSTTAVQHARQALELETGPLIVATAGSVFARAGNAPLAQRALELCTDLLDLPLYRIAHHRIRGEMAQARGEKDSALKEFRNAAALEPRLAHRQYLMEALEPSSPERLELCRDAVRNPWQVLRPPPIHVLGSLAIAVPVTTAANPSEPWALIFQRSSTALAKLV